MIQDIQTSDEFSFDVINKDGFVLVDFFADWCRPCKMMAPVLEAADQELGDRISFRRVNVDELEEVAQKYDLLGIPTFILFKDGEEKQRIIGYQTRENFLQSLRDAAGQD